MFCGPNLTGPCALSITATDQLFREIKGRTAQWAPDGVNRDNGARLEKRMPRHNCAAHIH
jgi:hypothetical protein